MDCEDMEENGTKTRSLRFEDYYNRRVFLRSYPLHFGAEDEKTNEEKVSATNKDTEKKPIRRMFSAVIHWGEGKVLILRKFKHKLQVYIIACMPISFKPPTALVSI
jgi:hemin uptake protein HemP